MAEETEFEKMIRESDQHLAETDEHISDMRSFMSVSVEESEKLNRLAGQALRDYGRVAKRVSANHARQLDDIDQFLRDADRELSQREGAWSREDAAEASRGRK